MKLLHKPQIRLQTDRFDDIWGMIQSDGAFCNVGHEGGHGQSDTKYHIHGHVILVWNDLKWKRQQLKSHLDQTHGWKVLYVFQQTMPNNWQQIECRIQMSSN